jgi:hypothetical protein
MRTSRVRNMCRWPSVEPPVRPASSDRWAQSATGWITPSTESFFATLKKELVHRYSWPKRRELTSGVLEYTEAFYNPTRRHSTRPAGTPRSGTSPDPVRKDSLSLSLSHTHTHIPNVKDRDFHRKPLAYSASRGTPCLRHSARPIVTHLRPGNLLLKRGAWTCRASSHAYGAMMAAITG